MSFEKTSLQGVALLKAKSLIESKDRWSILNGLVILRDLGLDVRISLGFENNIEFNDEIGLGWYIKVNHTFIYSLKSLKQK